MAILVHGPQNGKYGIRCKFAGVGVDDTYPRVAGLISALEYFHNNPNGLIETTNAVVVGSEESTQNGASEVIPTENGATLALAEGDNAHFLRSVIIGARDAGVLRNSWIVSISQDGLLMSFTDPSNDSAVARRRLRAPASRSPYASN